MEKRVGTWGQGSENGLREDGSGDKAVTSLGYRWERMRASLACGKDECQPGLSGNYTMVKANVWEEGSQGPTPPLQLLTSPPSFLLSLSDSGRGHGGAEVQVLSWPVLGGLSAARGDGVPVHRGALPIPGQPAAGAWARSWRSHGGREMASW